jgi:hypothetical protein
MYVNLCRRSCWIARTGTKTALFIVASHDNVYFVVVSMNGRVGKIIQDNVQIDYTFFLNLWLLFDHPILLTVLNIYLDSEWEGPPCCCYFWSASPLLFVRAAAAVNAMACSWLARIKSLLWLRVCCERAFNWYLNVLCRIYVIFHAKQRNVFPFLDIPSLKLLLKKNVSHPDEKIKDFVSKLFPGRFSNLLNFSFAYSIDG